MQSEKNKTMLFKSFDDDDDNSRFNIDKYIKQRFTYQEFLEEFGTHKTLKLTGYGFFYTYDGDKYHNYNLFKFKSFLIGFYTTSNFKVGISSTGKFQNMLLISSDILNLSHLFDDPSSNNENSSQFNDFKIELIVDTKLYDYQNDTKILISKAGDKNIDLYFSMVINKADRISQVKINSHIKSIVKRMQLEKVLSERIENIKKNRN